MKTNKILSALMLILLAVFVVQCEKHGDRFVLEDEDEISGKKDWAGPGGEDNPHTNASPGITKGGDYGDLYVLLRDEDGVPTMEQYLIEGEWIWKVQPVDSEGISIGYDTEGELNNSLAAIPVEFGRLNLVRSPDVVLNQGLDEAMKVLRDEDDDDDPVVQSIEFDFCGRLTSTYLDLSTTDPFDVIVKTIDSPRENLAIYKYIMQNMYNEFEYDWEAEEFTDVPNRLLFLAEEYGMDLMEIAASCFAAGSDKTGTVNIDEVVYINTFMKCIGPASDIIINTHEKDPLGDPRAYFNFTLCDGHPFNYTREVYETRYIQYLYEGLVYHPVDENGLSTGPIYTIRDVMDGLGPEPGNKFTLEWGSDPDESQVLGFTIAIDDAVQVLDLIHGSSFIRSVPYSEADNPADL